VAAGIAAVGAVLAPPVQSALARRAGAPDDVVRAAASALRDGALRVAVLALVAAGLFFLVARGRLTLVRAVPFLAALIFVDVFVTTADLAWTRPTTTARRPPYLPEGDARGLRVMRLEEIASARLALNEAAFSEEQFRQATLLSPMTNLPLHTAVLDPYGFYLADVARAMAELAATAPLALAEATASDIVLAPPTMPAPWLARAVDDHRLRPTHALAAGALVLRVQRPLPRSFLAGAASLAPRSAIARQLAESLDRVLLTAGTQILAGRLAPMDPAQIPVALLDAPTTTPTPVLPTAWRPGAGSYQVTVASPSLLVEMDAFMPGWHVFVDGREQPILQANVFGRAVPLPVGQHTVAWVFTAPGLVAAILASWIGLLVAALALLGKQLRWPFLREA
jgi:hypothetical protein